MPVPEGMTREILIEVGAGSLGILAGLDAFHAFVEIQSGLAFLLVGDDANEEVRFRRPDRGGGIRHNGLGGGIRCKSHRQHREGKKSAFEHDLNWREGRQCPP